MKILSIFCILLTLSSIAQTELDEGAMNFRNEGVRYVSPDSLYSIFFRFRMQNQAAIRSISGDNLTIGEAALRIRRLRMRLDGNVISPRLTYYIQLSFSEADLDSRFDNNPKVTRDAIIYYRFSPKTYVGFGQAKLPGNRQRVISSGNLQFAERSIANNTLTIDRDVGFFAYFHPYKDKFNLKLALTSGEGRNSAPTRGGFAYTGRLEWLPFGVFENDGDYSEGDLEFTKKPRLSIGVAASSNNRALKTGGQLGRSLVEETDIQTYIADMMIKYSGWAFLGEYFVRQASNGVQFLSIHNPVYVYQGNGLNIQLSKMLSKKVELAARYAFINPFEPIRAFEKKNEQVMLGVNRYLMKHRVKSQLNLVYLSNNGNWSTQNPGNTWQLVFQLELGI
jgi:hypothetical protein